MPLTPYARVLGVPRVRQAFILGALIRLPFFAGAMALTLHVVTTLERSYGSAGLVAGVFTLGAAIASPWRGRLLDRRGLRPTLAPSILVTGICWLVAPFLPFWPLLVLSALIGLYTVPSFIIIRQIALAAIGPAERKTLLAVDAITTELIFMVAPALGVWAATTWSTTWVLLVFQMLAVAAAVVLWWVNPPLQADDRVPVAMDRPPARQWCTPAIVGVCLAGIATTLSLSGADLAFVAALRSMHAQQSLGLVLAVWGAGSLLGGVIYGAMHRHLSVYLLLAGLAFTTLPLAAAAAVPSLLVFSFITGLFCAPTLTAGTELLTRLTPEQVRGEAMGWHGSALTVGSAIGAPLAGVAIDRWGWQAGFIAAGLVALAIALLGAGLATFNKWGRGAWLPAPRIGQDVSSE